MFYVAPMVATLHEQKLYWPQSGQIWVYVQETLGCLAPPRWTRYIRWTRYVRGESPWAFSTEIPHGESARGLPIFPQRFPMGHPHRDIPMGNPHGAPWGIPGIQGIPRYSQGSLGISRDPWGPLKIASDPLGSLGISRDLQGSPGIPRDPWIPMHP